MRGHNNAAARDGNGQSDLDQHNHDHQIRQSKGLKGFFPRSRSVENATPQINSQSNAKSAYAHGHAMGGHQPVVSSEEASRRHPNAAEEVTDSFKLNPRVPTPPGSPSSTPPKKNWEHQMKNFLKKRKPDTTDSTTTIANKTGSGRGSSASTPPTPTSRSSTISPQHPPTPGGSPSSATRHATTGQNSQQNNNNSKKPFYVLPGTKRLLVRKSPHNQKPTMPLDDLDMVLTRSNSPSSPPTTSRIAPPISPRAALKNTGGLFAMHHNHHHHEDPQQLQHLQQHDEKSVRGGKLFHAVFSRSTSEGMFPHPNSVNGTQFEPPGPQLLQANPRSSSSGSGLDRNRRHKSMDELDGTLRKGLEKSYSPDGPLFGSSTNNVDSGTPSPPPPDSHLAPTHLQTLQNTYHPKQDVTSTTNDKGEDYDMLRTQQAENEWGEGLDALLASASATTLSQRLIPPCTSSLPSSSSWGHYSFQQHQQLQSDEIISYAHQTSMDLSAPTQAGYSPTRSHLGRLMATVQLDLQQKSFQQLKPQERPDLSYSDGITDSSVSSTSVNGLRQLGNLGAVMQSHHAMVGPPEEGSTIGTNEPSADPELKKAFTAFHNSSQFAKDAASPFLGDDLLKSSYYLGHDPAASYMASLSRHHHNYHQNHPSSAMKQLMVTQAGGGGRGGCSVPQHALSERSFRPPVNLSTSLPPEAVDEQNIVIHRSLRLLKPFEAADTWQTGRRYLISPAALAACPLSVVTSLSDTQSTRTAVEAATDNGGDGDASCFGIIDLGEALITYVGEHHHLSLGRWSSCRLVLRQNFLLEYDVSTSIQGLPRGFAHLQYACAYPHDDFPDALELQFFASPCAKADQRVLMIRVKNREDRDHWITCLNDAAQLRITDLYDYDERFEFGRGRYAAVYPARRKTKGYYNSMQPLVADGETPDKATLLDRCDCALKIVDKNQFWSRVVMGRERADTLVREPSVQATLTSKYGRTIPTFLQIRGFFETSDHVVMELELLEGTDLFDYISSKGVLSEKEAASILRDMLLSLDAMNRVGLAHRDVKPANVLMCNKEKDGVTAKVGDFGMSTFVGVDGLVRGRCGTPGYVAPEILTAGSRVGYGNKVDVFSAGVTLYVMLCGYEPFYGETEKDLVEANKQAVIDFPESDWKSVSHDARDLVSKMTRPDPSERLSAKEALAHLWITANTSNDTNLFQRRTSDLPAVGACVIS